MLSHFFSFDYLKSGSKFILYFLFWCYGSFNLLLAVSKSKEIRWETTSENTTNERNNKNNENNSLEFLKMLRIESCCPFFITFSYCFFFPFPVFSFIFPCLLHVFITFFPRVRFFFTSKLPGKPRGQKLPDRRS